MSVHPSVVYLFSIPVLMDYFHLLAFMNNGFINIHEEICVNICFHVSWLCTQEWNSGFYGNYMFNSEELSDCSHSV